MAKKAASKKSGGAAKASGGAAKKGGSAAKSGSGGGSREKSLSDLIGALAEKTGLPKTKTREFLDAHAELLVEELRQTGSVHLAGVGKLKLGERAARQGRNPATGEPITIAASKTVKLAGGKAFKDKFK